MLKRLRRRSSRIKRDKLAVTRSRLTSLRMIESTSVAILGLRKRCWITRRLKCVIWRRSSSRRSVRSRASRCVSTGRNSSPNNFRISTTRLKSNCHQRCSTWAKRTKPSSTRTSVCILLSRKSRISRTSSGSSLSSKMERLYLLGRCKRVHSSNSQYRLTYNRLCRLRMKFSSEHLRLKSLKYQKPQLPGRRQNQLVTQVSLLKKLWKVQMEKSWMVRKTLRLSKWTRFSKLQKPRSGIRIDQSPSLVALPVEHRSSTQPFRLLRRLLSSRIQRTKTSTKSPRLLMLRMILQIPRTTLINFHMTCCALSASLQGRQSWSKHANTWSSARHVKSTLHSSILTTLNVQSAAKNTRRLFQSFIHEEHHIRREVCSAELLY